MTLISPCFGVFFPFFPPNVSSRESVFDNVWYCDSKQFQMITIGLQITLIVWNYVCFCFDCCPLALSVCLFVFLAASASVCLSACLSVSLFLSLSVCVSVSLCLSLSLFLSLFLSLPLSLSLSLSLSPSYICVFTGMYVCVIVFVVFK